MRGIRGDIEQPLVTLVNTVLDFDVNIENYQRVNIDVYSESILMEILHKCTFFKAGNIFDYPDDLPQPDEVDGYDMAISEDLFQRIAVSEKFNSVAFFTFERHSIYCFFLVDREKLKKFNKIVKKAMQQDTRANMFRGIDFICAKREYIEVTDATGESMKPADVTKKKVPKEKLVYSESSTLTEVLHDINTFFLPKTKEIYKKIMVPYKRGIMLVGEPGNGKSASLRQVIRQLDGIAKIVINPSVSNITKVLSALTRSLDGAPAIVIIEDMDSLITDRNRSEFLNILDGVDIKSGIYFVGTTNYPDKIDPAFMNRSGRFDRTFEIKNPDEETRRAFFKSRNIGDLLDEYKVHNDDTIPDSAEGVVELMVKYSDDLPMATLKEVMTSTQYKLAANPDMTVEDAVRLSYETLKTSREEHTEMHGNFMERKMEAMRERMLSKKSHLKEALGFSSL